MIEIEKVNFRYLNSKKSILQDFSLNISKGEIVGIIGPTGSGKSTICYLFNGLIPHTIKGIFTGSIIIDGIDTADTSVEEMSEKVGYILQEPSFQIASPHVESEITFGMENLGLSLEEARNLAPKFKVPGKTMTRFGSFITRNIVYKVTKKIPILKKKVCVQCGQCFEVCPAKA